MKRNTPEERGGEGRDGSLPRTIAAYSASKIVTQAVSVLGAFVRPKLLIPELYGLWNILNVVLRYASFAHGGSTIAMRYLVPFYEAKNEGEACNKLKATVFTGTLFTYGVISTALMIAAILKTGMAVNARTGLFAMGILVLFLWQQEYLGSLFKAYQEFIILGKARVLHVTLSLVFSIPLILVMNIYGLYLSAIASYALMVFFLRSQRNFTYGRGFSPAVFRKSVAKGFPVMVYDFSMELLGTIDRIIIVSLLGTAHVGYYGVAVMMFAFIKQVPGAAREVLEPKMMGSLDKSSKKDFLTEYLFGPLINNAYYVTFLIGTAVLLIPTAIGLVLPKYLPGIVPAQVLAVGGFFLSLAFLTRGVIVAYDWQVRILPLMAASVAIEAVLSYALLRSGAGLPGAALATCSAYAFMFFGTFWFFSVKFSDENLPWGRLLARIMTPFVAMGCLLAALLNLAAIFEMPEALKVAMSTLLYWGIMSALFLVALKREPLLEVPSFPWKRHGGKRR